MVAVVRTPAIVGLTAVHNLHLNSLSSQKNQKVCVLKYVLSAKNEVLHGQQRPGGDLNWL